VSAEALPTTVVVPTVGRPSLTVLLTALAAGAGPRPAEILVVDDRPEGAATLDLPTRDLADADLPVRVLVGGGRGPAHARNVGWRHARTPWVSFLDDDVVPEPQWRERLADDLARVAADVAGSQGRVEVPLPAHRRPTDWERLTAGLSDALWITADLTYRRHWLVAVGGFDERFPRAFREDADLALRIQHRGGVLVRGRRKIQHPVRPVDDWVSLRTQAGNADDPLMARLHGRDWHLRAGAVRGRRGRHAGITAAAVLAVAAAAARRPWWSAGLTSLWLAGTAEFAWARIAPGPRDRAEVRRMLLTSAAIPPAACVHTVRGWWRHRSALPWRGLPEAVLLDRDGTLVHDVPYNGDPALVRPLPGVAEALDALRAEGVRLGVVTNQSAVGTGRISADQMHAVNAAVDEQLGPFDTWQVCPHPPQAGCDCRKPAPGLVKSACAALDVPADRVVVIGDIASDLGAAEAAGAASILVPTAATRPDEVTAAAATGRLQPTLQRAVAAVLGGRW
jgi:histidinol-phosphate phosphatase family protein